MSSLGLACSPCGACATAPNVYLTSQLPCHHIVKIMSALPLCRTSLGFDDRGTTGARCAGARGLCLSAFHPPPPSAPPPPGVYVSSSLLCHSLSCHQSHWPFCDEKQKSGVCRSEWVSLSALLHGNQWCSSRLQGPNHIKIIGQHVTLDSWGWAALIK